jgi:hypothetical protein
MARHVKTKWIWLWAYADSIAKFLRLPLWIQRWIWRRLDRSVGAPSA